MRKYKIAHKLGAGGMGDVFVAKNLESGDDVAIKILQPQFSASKESQDRFLREMKVSAELEHPNIIRVHDYGESDGTLYYVMDLVEGRSIKEATADGPLDPHDAVDVAEGIARALAYIHPRDLIHRDLKPANVMVTPTFKPILLDFGLVKALAEVSLTMTGKVIGTPRYMAPEMMITGKVDRRSDLYQLGAILYEMVTGKHAIPGKTRKEVAQRALYEVPVNPSEAHPEVDADLENLVMNALEKNPDERYADAEAFLADVAAYKAGKSVPRRGSGRPAREARGKKKKRSKSQEAKATPSSQAPAARPGPAPGGASSRSGSLPPPRPNPGHDDLTDPSGTPIAAPGASASRSRDLGSQAFPLPSSPASGPPARPGQVSGSVASIAKTAALRTVRPDEPPPGGAVAIPESARKALGAALGLLGVLAVGILLRRTFFPLADYTAKGLTAAPLYGGVRASWTSEDPYVDAVEVWAEGQSPAARSFDSVGTRHEVEAHGLPPGTRCFLRVIYPDGERSEPVEFQTLDLPDFQAESRLVGGFEAVLEFSTGEVPVGVQVEYPEAEVSTWTSPRPGTRHEVPVTLPGDAGPAKVTLTARIGEDLERELASYYPVEGLASRLETALRGPPETLAQRLPPLERPVQQFLGDRTRASPKVKARLYQSLTPLRDRAARRRAADLPEQGDPGRLLPAGYGPTPRLLGAEAYPVRFRQAQVFLVDQLTPGSGFRRKEVTGQVASDPAGLDRAKAAAIAVSTLGPAPPGAVMRVEVGDRVQLSIYLDQHPRSGSREPFVHTFDPRLLKGLNAINVSLKLWTVTNQSLGPGLGLGKVAFLVQR